MANQRFNKQVDETRGMKDGGRVKKKVIKLEEMSLEERVNNMKNTGRENLLEEVGRLDARKNPNSNDRAEKRRVMSEIKDGYKKGGKVKKKRGCGMAKRGFGRA